jgi:hypothetical protein
MRVKVERIEWNPQAILQSDYLDREVKEALLDGRARPYHVQGRYFVLTQGGLSKRAQ